MEASVLNSGLSTLGAFITLIVVLGEWIFGKQLKWSGEKARYATWGLGAALGALAAYLKLGVFALVQAEGHFAAWYIYGPTMGFVAALAANGTFGVEMVRSVLVLLGIRLPEKA